MGTRASSGFVLAGLRQPAASSAIIANETSRTELVVTESILTQSSTVPDPVVEVPRPRGQMIVAMTTVALLVGAVLLATMPTTWFKDKRDCVERAADKTCARLGKREPIELGVVPAQALPVKDRLTVSGVTTEPSAGSLLFVTVREPTLNMLDWLALRSNPAGQLLSHQDVYGDETPSQQRERSFRMMRTSEDVAKYVAFKYAGYDAKLTPGAVVVDQIFCLELEGDSCVKKVQAAEVLQPTDTVVSVNGSQVPTLDDLRRVMSTVTPGSVVDVGRKRGDKVEQVKVTTVSLVDHPDVALLGFQSGDTATVTMPDGVDATFNMGDVGGPSAGLAFTLTMIDALTSGDLLGAKAVAVTGTINLDGKVGAIGGLPSKASAVMQAGAKFFLVPASQGDIEQARRVVGDRVEIIPVATVDEAIAALVKIGGTAPGKIAAA